MGFRSTARAKVWDVVPKQNNITSVRLSTSRKNKKTDQYEQDFGGFVDFIGTATAAKALNLKKGDLITLGDVSVSNRYDKESGKTSYSFAVFSFEPYTPEGTAEKKAAAKADPEPDDDDTPF